MPYFRRIALFATLLLQAYASSAATSNTDCFFNWAEKNYGALFAPASTSATAGNYYYRYYSATKSFLAIDNNTQHFAYLGPASGNSLLDMGAAANWLAQTGCQNSSAAVTSSFYDFYYLQNLNGIAATTGTIVDNGANVAGTVTFGLTGTSATFIPQANGNGYSWGNPMSYGNGFGSNPNDVNVPAVAAICQTVPNDGGSRGKTTNVLVTKNATAITNAASLANLTFNTYYEDCAAVNGESLSFDGSGNFTHASNVGGTVSLSTDQITAALNGTPAGGPDNGMVTFNAYSYVDSQSGQKHYVMIEHGSNKTSNLSRGYLGVWLGQQ